MIHIILNEANEMKYKNRTYKKRKIQTLSRRIKQFEKMTRKYRKKGCCSNIFLKPGKYKENITILQEVSLIGYNP